MKLDMSQEEVLKQQMADDPVASVVFFNKIQKDSSQQQKVTSSTASCKMPEDDSKKSDEVSNLSTETISIKPLEASSTTSHQESILGWSNDNKKLLETTATLLEKSEGEVLNEIPQDILSDPECLKDYLSALIDNLKINDSCTNDNSLDDVPAGSSHLEKEMSSAACTLTGENLTVNEDFN